MQNYAYCLGHECIKSLCCGMADHNYIKFFFFLYFYVLQFRWWWPVMYSIVLIILPLFYIFYKLFKANTAKAFHDLSNWTKFVMLTGIISMIFFYFYL